MKRLMSFFLAAGLLLSAYALTLEDMDITPAVILYSQGDYIDPNVLSDFTRETGIVVEYVVSGDEEDDAPMECDLLLADAYSVSLLAETGCIQRLDTIRFSPWGKIDARWLELGGLEGYAVPCLWTTMGLIYDPTRTELQVTQWADLADPTFSGQVLMPVDAEDLVTVALAALGLETDSDAPEALASAGLWLKRQSPLVLDYCSEEDLAAWFRSGDAVLAVCPASTAIELMAELPDLSFVIPSGESWQTVLCYAVSAETEKGAAVYELLRYLCEAEALAKNAAYSGWSVTSTQAYSLLSPTWRSNPLAYPSLNEHVLTDLLPMRDSRAQSFALLDALSDFRRMELTSPACVTIAAW